MGLLKCFLQCEENENKTLNINEFGKKSLRQCFLLNEQTKLGRKHKTLVFCMNVTAGSLLLSVSALMEGDSSASLWVVFTS